MLGRRLCTSCDLPCIGNNQLVILIGDALDIDPAKLIATSNACRIIGLLVPRFRAIVRGWESFRLSIRIFVDLFALLQSADAGVFGDHWLGCCSSQLVLVHIDLATGDLGNDISVGRRVLVRHLVDRTLVREGC